jgi:alkylated DNA repair dioxygenase AlkB
VARTSSPTFGSTLEPVEADDLPALTWQPGLFTAAAGPSPLTFDRVERHELTHGAWIDHGRNWLADPDPLFAELLANLPWRGGDVEMYGRMVAQPRLSMWWKLGLAGPEVERLAPEHLERIDAMAGAIGEHYGVAIDGVGANLYRDGTDSVAFHGDRHARADDDPDVVVAIVSLGSARRLQLRPKGGGASRSIVLHPGDLLVMGGSCQRTWEHGIPKTARAGPRISLSFRHPAR